MKKNVMMRVAALLMVCVLATTCGISGTFAKYVTTGTGSDSARVAKWGVNVAVSGSLFNTSYSDAEGEIIVKSEATPQDDIVAPFTENEEGMTFTISGNPEVACKVSVNFSATSEIQLAAGTYTNPTGSGADLVLGTPYYPVTFYLYKDSTKVVEGTVNDIQTYLTNNINTVTYAPDGSIDAIYKLTWAWTGDNDQADTYLGNAANGGATTGATLDMNVTFTITVEQIDNLPTP